MSTCQFCTTLGKRICSAAIACVYLREYDGICLVDVNHVAKPNKQQKLGQVYTLGDPTGIHIRCAIRLKLETEGSQ